jgi:predicted TIM-barrel fold metal-dependent hydrolase
MTAAGDAAPVIDARVRLPMSLRAGGSSGKPRSQSERYDAVFDLASTRDKTLEELISDLEIAGVDHAVIHAEYEFGDGVDELNETVAAVVDDWRTTQWGVGTVSLLEPDIRRMVGQVERVAALGLIGINLQPAFFGLAIDDRRLYPVYAKAGELGLVVWMHTGVNYTTNKPMALERPDRLDRVMCDFDDLTMVAGHGGWPWVTEMVALLRRHPTLYVDFGGLSPRYVDEVGTGWEVMRRLMNNQLSDQVLFASDWPVFSPARAVAEWRNTSLNQQALHGLLGGNASRVLRECRVP